MPTKIIESERPTPSERERGREGLNLSVEERRQRLAWTVVATSGVDEDNLKVVVNLQIG
jgi:hypothetical protein